MEEEVREEAVSKEVKKEKGSGIKKVLIAALCGVVFGLFASFAFFAVKEVGDAYNEKAASRIPVAGPSSQVDSEVSFSQVNADIATTMPVEYGEQQNVTTVVTDVTEVVENTMPAIVSITNEYTYTYFYYEQEAEAKGSGIIVGSNENELLIATNYHVIEGNDELYVTFCDDSDAPALVKGTDPGMDLAVLAVSMEDIANSTKGAIAVALLGDSDALKVGEPAIAIGNSLGYGQSVTTGVISAVNREMDMNLDGNTRMFIQTDAAINGGNSGGALLNIKGEVIGINSNKIGGSTVEGMGYAIPISEAKPIIEELMLKETRDEVDEANQGCLGITGSTVSSSARINGGYPDGVYVASIYEGSAAEAAGIQEGDFIYLFDGDKITSMEQLQRILKYYRVGESVEIGIYRYNGSKYEATTVTVTLGGRDIFNG